MKLRKRYRVPTCGKCGTQHFNFLACPSQDAIKAAEPVSRRPATVIRRSDGPRVWHDHPRSFSETGGWRGAGHALAKTSDPPDAA